MIKYCLQRLIYILLALFIVLIGILILVCSTTFGSRWLINKALQPIPDIKIQTIEGSFLHGITASGIRYQNSITDINIGTLSLNCQPLSLFYGTINITSLQANQINWKQLTNKEQSLNPAKTDKQSNSLFNLPFQIQLKKTTLHDIKLSFDDTEQYINSIHVQARINNSHINIQSLALDSSLLKFEGHGRLETTTPYPLNFKVQWQRTISNNIPFSGILKIDGSLNTINVQHELLTPHPINTTGHIYLNQQPSLTLTNTVEKYHWGKSQSELWAEIKQANITVNGWLDNFTIDAKIVSDLAEIKDVAIDMQANGNAAEVNITRLIVTSPDLQASGEAKATVILSPNLKIHTSSKIILADNRLSIDGTFSEKLDLQWQLNAINLQAFLPQLSGAISSKGSIKGKIDKAIVNATVRGKKLRYGEYAIEHLEAISKSKNIQNSAIDIRARDIQIGQHIINEFNSSIKGELLKHHITATMQQKYGLLQLEADGHYQASNWNGKINTASFQPSGFGNWQLGKSAQVQLSKESVSMQANCWHYQSAKLCLNLQFNNDSGLQLSTQLTELPLHMFQTYIAKPYKLAGRLNAQTTIRGQLDSLFLDAHLTTPGGALIIQDREDTHLEYQWQDAVLTVQGQTGQHWQIVSSAKLPGTGKFNQQLSIDSDQNLQGFISINLDNLRVLEPFIPLSYQLQGRLIANTKIAGSIQQPHLLLNAQLSQGYSYIPVLRLTLRDMNITANSSDINNIRLSANARSAQGFIEVSGILNNPANKNWQLSMDITGTDFQFINLPQVQSTINPNLNLRLSQQLLDIQGTAIIPTAALDIKTLPSSAVDISADAEELGKQAPSNTQKLEVTSRINLSLGHDITFQGFGFNSQLSGQLDISEKTGRASQAFGELKLINGYYKAYGQKLIIAEGSKLIFQGSPDNPSLSVRAIRKTSNVTVGLELGGTLKRPQSRLFSSPSLPETEIAAILVTGKSLSSASKSDAGAIINAIASWGLERGGSITQKLSNAFKLDVVSIDSQDNLQQSTLLLGKHLTPRLFIKYAIGLFDQSNTLGLEYQLNKNFKLEAQSGGQRQIDFIYNIEK